MFKYDPKFETNPVGTLEELERLRMESDTREALARVMGVHMDEIWDRIGRARAIKMTYSDGDICVTGVTAEEMASNVD